MFEKILIANRGEIACRIIRTARAMGIKTVAVYSDIDRTAQHVIQADEAIALGGASPAESYLRIDAILAAARQTGAQAIHPGYGFLSENTQFCAQVAEAGLTFIGPSLEAITSMGSKSAAKALIEIAGVPVLPGYHGVEQDAATLAAHSERIGYPVLLKAVSGGGGKGMRQVDSADQFEEALQAAKSEALTGFGDADMLVEKFLPAPRHVEVQVFCDEHGNGVYLFDRDCSVQRRHQKIIEEAPAPGLSAELRKSMGEAAVRAATAINYSGAGTIEFLLDIDQKFYFMEMNTRLQVEHPVSEMITGVDLVEWQLRVANGETLPKSQAELVSRGHAFEARIYAEHAEQDFLPSSGQVLSLVEPQLSTSVRIDSAIVQGDDISPFYDPMIAKLITWGETRAEALLKLNQALDEYRILGLHTNLQFLRRLSNHSAFKNADVNTGFIADHYNSLFPQTDLLEARLASACFELLNRSRKADNEASCTNDPYSPWACRDGWRIGGQASLAVTIQEEGEGPAISFTATKQGNDSFTVALGGEQYVLKCHLDNRELTLEHAGRRSVWLCSESANKVFLGSTTFAYHYIRPVARFGRSSSANEAAFQAPMTGTVLELMTALGEPVEEGAALLRMEAMKMEHTIRAPIAGAVAEFFVTAGQQVEGGRALLEFAPAQGANNGE